MARPPKAQHIGRYELGEKIAEGGMAKVFLGRATVGGSGFVALKVLHDNLAQDDDYVKMFLDEAALLAKLAHPSTVQLYETGVDRGQHYIAMELLIGESLLNVWTTFKDHEAKIPFGIVAFIGARVAEGLHHAHELRDDEGMPRNVVHRDVNPSNIFLTFDGRIKIIDFGLARSEKRLTRTDTGIVKGKVAYLAPEQIEGYAPDRRADVFALGTTLWELSLLRRLFRQENDIDTVRAIQECNVPDPRNLDRSFPTGLWRVIERALSRDPNGRYSNCEQMRADLDDVALSLGGQMGAPEIAQLMAQLCAWPPPEKKR
ncbi:MAG: serine/threonine-protein kinase [Polyangiaceae bacterium]